MNRAFVRPCHISVQFHAFLSRVCTAFVRPCQVDTLLEAVAEQALTSSLPGKTQALPVTFQLVDDGIIFFYTAKINIEPVTSTLLWLIHHLDVTSNTLSHPKGAQ